MTTEKRLEQLERRLDRAERHNRWLPAGMAVCLGIGLLACGGVSRCLWRTIVHANEFVLEDRKGKPRATLTMTEAGTPRLRLDHMELDVVDRSELDVSERDMDGHGTGLLVLGKGRTRLVLGVSKHGTGLLLLDGKGKPRVALGQSNDRT